MDSYARVAQPLNKRLGQGRECDVQPKVIVVDATGRVLDATLAARALLASGALLCCAFDRLAGADRRNGVRLALALNEGGEIQAPMGRAIIGGVITSTVLTLLVIPTFYEIFDNMRTWFSQRVGLTPPRTGQFPTFKMPVPEVGD